MFIEEYNYDYNKELQDLGVTQKEDSMKSAYGFIRFDTEDEFKNWFRNKSVTRTVTKLQIHHTGSPSYSNFYKSGGGHEDELTRQKNMKSFHVNSRGINDIAQHFTVYPNGKIVTGRSLNSNPAGITGFNANAICVEIYGNFDKGHDTMTAEQKKAVIMLYGEMCKKFKLTPSTNTIRCHAWFTSGGTYLGDYIPGKSRKSCPGTNFMGFGNSKAAIENNFIPLVKAYINGNAATIPTTPQKPTTSVKPTTEGKYIVRYLQTVLNSVYGAGLTVDGLYGPKTEAAIRTLKVGSRGDHVIWLQKALVNRGHKIDVDGIFGNGTKAAVIAYQKSRGLTADGLAGKGTHKAIIND